MWNIVRGHSPVIHKGRNPLGELVAN